MKILVPIDGSPESAAGVREAIRIASGRRDAKIRLVHVMERLPAMQGMETAITRSLIENLTGFGEKILRKAKAQVERSGVRAETAFIDRPQSSAADGILQEARRWKPDLIVMGTHGRRGLARLVLGSDAEKVLRAATVPVVLARKKR